MLTTAKYAGKAPYANKKDGSTAIYSGPYGAYSTKKIMAVLFAPTAQ